MKGNDNTEGNETMTVSKNFEDAIKIETHAPNINSLLSHDKYKNLKIMS